MDNTPRDRTRSDIIVAATIGNMLNTTCAVHAVFGSFLIPLSQSFGWTRASISVVLGIISLAGAVIYPLAGSYADRHGVRRMLLAGNLGLALGIAALALSNGSLTRFYLTFVVIGIFGTLCGTSSYSKLVSDWFETHRGTALGFTAGFGNGAGATLMPILAGVLLTAWGWRVAYLGIAATVLLAGFPILFLKARDAPYYGSANADTRVLEGLTLAEAMRTPRFWVLLVSIAAGGGCTTAVFSHVVPILAERGVGLAVSTTVLGVFAMVCAGWQIATGSLLDRLSSPRLVAPMFLCAVGGIAMLELAHSIGALIGGGVLLGIALGAQYGALPFLIARYFGLRAFGVITGTMYAVVVVLQGVTPVLLDHAFDQQGTYRHALVVIGLCLGGCALLLLALPGYRRTDVRADLPASAHA
jgi:MFS family permease